MHLEGMGSLHNEIIYLLGFLSPLSKRLTTESLPIRCGGVLGKSSSVVMRKLYICQQENSRYPHTEI